MNKKNIFVTIKKEMRSIFRDKRTLMMILGFPMIIAVMIFLYGTMEDTLMGKDDTKYNIGINYETNEVEKELMKELFLVPTHYETKEKLDEIQEVNTWCRHITGA